MLLSQRQRRREKGIDDDFHIILFFIIVFYIVYDSIIIHFIIADEDIALYDVCMLVHQVLVRLSFCKRLVDSLLDDCSGLCALIVCNARFTAR